MSVNKVILLGNVSSDVKTKEFSDGGKIASFGFATNDRAYKLKDGTEIPEKVEFHNVVLKNGLAGVAEKYIKKGDKLYLEGKICTRIYESNGVKNYMTEIIVSVMEMLSSKKSDETQQPQHQQFVEQPNDLPF